MIMLDCYINMDIDDLDNDEGNGSSLTIWLQILTTAFLDLDESDLNEYMLDPTDPVVCVPEQDDPEY